MAVPLAGDIQAASPNANPNIGGSQVRYPYGNTSVNYNTAASPFRTNPTVTNPNLYPYGGATPSYPKDTTAFNPTQYGYGYTGSGWAYPEGPRGGTAFYTQPLPTRPLSPGELTATQPKQIPYSDAQLQAMFQQQVLADPTLVGQLGVGAGGTPMGTLPSQLAGQWQGSVLTPAQQALISLGGFGGFENDPSVQPILNQLRGVAGPTFKTPYGTANLGQGLGAALTDPDVLASAANNPYSTLNMLHNTAAGLRASDIAGIADRGMRNSSAVQNVLNQGIYNEGAAKSQAIQAVLGQIGGNVTGFNAQALQAGQTAAGYLKDAKDAIVQQMQQGLITIPTSYATNTNPVTGRPIGAGTPEYISSTPTNRFSVSGYGLYGRKPLY